jgi:hypothetical protein
MIISLRQIILIPIYAKIIRDMERNKAENGNRDCWL